MSSFGGIEGAIAPAVPLDTQPFEDEGAQASSSSTEPVSAQQEKSMEVSAMEEVMVGTSASAASSSSPPPTSKALVSSMSSMAGASADLAKQWSQKHMEVSEFQTLQLGPFPEGVSVEIEQAWYGMPDDPTRQYDVTEEMRSRYSPKDGVVISRPNLLFGDPAPLRMKRFHVAYRLSNLDVAPHDVSPAQYAEGFSRAGMVPIIALKAVTNTAGATMAGLGWAAGKMSVTVQNVVSGSDDSVADSAFFQSGFLNWLRFNGIFPSVSYEPAQEGKEVGPEDGNMKRTPIIVANHMCYLDGPVLAAVLGAPKIIAKKGTLDVPLLGQFAQEIGVMEVDRDDHESRAKTMEAIEAHVRNWKSGDRALLLFPEGSCSNGEDLLPFKKGAFVSGEPVRPVVLTYTGSWHPANVNFKKNRDGQIESTGDAEWCEQFLGHLNHSLQIKVLKPYHPNDIEKKSPEVYASNVRHRMLEAYKDLKEEVARTQDEKMRNPLQGFTELVQDGMSDMRKRVSSLGSSQNLSTEAVDSDPAVADPGIFSAPASTTSATGRLMSTISCAQNRKNKPPPQAVCSLQPQPRAEIRVDQ